MTEQQQAYAWQDQSQLVCNIPASDILETGTSFAASELNDVITFK
ncbi:hypothetical protein [Gimesia sp.]